LSSQGQIVNAIELVV